MIGYLHPRTNMHKSVYILRLFINYKYAYHECIELCAYLESSIGYGLQLFATNGDIVDFERKFAAQLVIKCPTLNLLTMN